MLPFRCATCVFFSPQQSSWSDRPSGRGQCRRHAPVLDKDDGRLRTLWPMVHDDSYCGEHAEIEAVVDEQLGLSGPPVRHTAEPAPVAEGPAWRCINCKEVTVSDAEPAKCVVCQCRELVRVDEPRPSEPTLP